MIKHLRFSIILLLLTCVSSIQAAVRTVEEARLIAGRFMAESKTVGAPAAARRAMSASLTSEPMQLVYTQMAYDNSQASLYIFSGDHGYVLVSADDRARAILGYADSAFDAENIPENMRVWLQMYADEIARLPRSATKSAPSVEDVEYFPVVEPLLGATAWNQSAPYNAHCPIDPSTQQRCVTGCMATATAQVMYHHKHPRKGNGSYSYQLYGQTISADFSQATYDWEHMLPYYPSGAYTQQEKDAVAQLMYHVGVACNMYYGSASSGAAMSYSMYAIQKYFDYDAAIRVLLKDYMDEEMILRTIAEDLLQSRPVYIEALTKKSEGHAFVCDGMQSNGFIHINWGWGGHNDGYFALTALNPTDQGIGGASDDGAFTEMVTLYTGIQPNQGGQSVPLLVASTMEWNSSMALSKKEQLKYTLSKFQNGGLDTENGKIALLIYKDSTLYDVAQSSFNWELKPMYHYKTVSNVTIDLSQLEEGNYEIVVGVDVNDKYATPIYFYGHGEKRYHLQVTADSLYLTECVAQQAYFGTEYATLQVTDLSENTGKNNLRLVMQTLDFSTSKGKVKSGSAIALDLFTTSSSSIIGSYAIDSENSQSVGTAASAYSLIMALQDGKQVNENFRSGVVTISQILGGHYVVDYYLQGTSLSVSGRCKISTIGVSSLRQSATGKVSPYTLTNETATSIDVAYAYDWVSQQKSSEQKQMPIYVHGMVSHIDAIPTETGGANFSISSDGSAAGTLYCHESKWLDKTHFATGQEIGLKDTVMMVGYLQLADMALPTLDGYIYDYRRYVPGSHTAVSDVEDGMVMSVEGRVLYVNYAHARETYVYDLMGHLVAAAGASTACTLALPAAGCYIVRGGQEVKKLTIE